MNCFVTMTQSGFPTTVCLPPALDGAYAVSAAYVLEQILQWIALLL